MLQSPNVEPNNLTRPIAEPASLRRRLASMVYESLPTFGVGVAIWFLPQLLLGVGLGVELPGELSMLWLVLAMGAYFVLVWHHLGQTLAMQTWQLQLVDAATGNKASFRQCLIRYILAWPSLLLIVTGLGVLWAGFVDRDRLFLHDRLAGTMLVFNPRRPS